MRHTVKLIGIFVLTILLSTLASAQFRGRTPGGDRGAPHMQGGMMMLKALRAELNLTDKQVAAIQDLMDAHQKACIDMEKDAALQRLEMQKQFRNRSEMDLDLYRKSLEKASVMRINNQVARLRLRQDVEKVLTMEQREILRQRMDKDMPPHNRHFTRGRTSRGFGRFIR
ncbi:MAG: Spy/CpxP family protein refolding chaperone [Acidobacteria bacterium]|nr:Spy/CpxP family protein refolding chaperone [Acidobacteriota bacterium]MBU4329108.1 Spy/CpxP family protein refolding chaperone [Acidobacteriota bacterium]MBU4495725.1 Spy/CpxP family protein refolding chaperone [Acidobacteriota bacterium]MCG2817317.1 Spy/CpxP family protein refolding chaperone [Candidatus Aminicenantes bacterium]